MEDVEGIVEDKFIEHSSEIDDNQVYEEASLIKERDVSVEDQVDQEDHDWGLEELAAEEDGDQGHFVGGAGGLLLETRGHFEEGLHDVLQAKEYE